MSSETARLRRLLEDELGECRPEDLADRLAALDDLEGTTPLDHASEHAAVFDALGNETRYRLVRLLAAAEDDLCVCELTPLVGVSDSAVSHALRALVDAGLVTRRSAGRWNYYDTTDRAEALLATFDRTAGAETGASA
jgi:DNA-binding transcriptional ArsR family regulator